MSAEAPLPDRPRVLEGGVLAVIAAGVVNGVQAFGLLASIDGARRRVAAQAPASADEVAAILGGLAAAALVYSLVLIGLALLLRIGRTWARVTLLVLSPLSLLGVVALTTPGITSAILVGLAVYMLYRREVTEWVVEVRRRRLEGAS